MPWEPRSYKGKQVWVRVDEEGQPLLENGSVRMKHDKEQNQTYQANLENITLTPRDYHEEHPPPENVIECYTDGSSLNKTQQGGDTGVGVVLRSQEGYREISEYAGIGTNNTAELDAIHTALNSIKDRDRPTRIFSDSEYSIKALTQWIHGWRKNNWKTSSGKPVSNQDRIVKIDRLMQEFNDLDFNWVEGHAGDVFNERADHLAVQGAQEGQNETVEPD